MDGQERGAREAWWRFHVARDLASRRGPVTVIRPSRCAADHDSAPPVPLDERDGLGFDTQVGVPARVGVADLGVAVSDEQPVVPVAGWFVGEGEGDQDPPRRELRSVELCLTSGPRGEARIGMGGRDLDPSLAPLAHGIDDHEQIGARLGELVGRSCTRDSKDQPERLQELQRLFLDRGRQVQRPSPRRPTGRTLQPRPRRSSQLDQGEVASALRRDGTAHRELGDRAEEQVALDHRADRGA